MWFLKKKTKDRVLNVGDIFIYKHIGYDPKNPFHQKKDKEYAKVLNIKGDYVLYSVLYFYYLTREWVCYKHSGTLTFFIDKTIDMTKKDQECYEKLGGE